METQSSLHDRVCEEIRVVMARRKVSQSEVARRAGWSVYYLNHRMLGKTPMNVNDLETLARILKVEPTTFFPRSDVQNLCCSHIRTVIRRYARVHSPRRPFLSLCDHPVTPSENRCIAA